MRVGEAANAVQEGGYLVGNCTLRTVLPDPMPWAQRGDIDIRKRLASSSESTAMFRRSAEEKSWL